MLACQQQFVLEVVTVPCTRNNFVHLTSFFEALLVNCNTSIQTPNGPPDWYEILHHWKERGRAFTQAAGIKPSTYCVCRQQSKFTTQIANFPQHRCCEEFLFGIDLFDTDGWEGGHTWDYQSQSFGRYRGLRPWLESGGSEMPPSRVATLAGMGDFFFPTACAQKGLACWCVGIDHCTGRISQNIPHLTMCIGRTSV